MLQEERKEHKKKRIKVGGRDDGASVVHGALLFNYLIYLIFIILQGFFCLILSPWGVCDNE